MAATTDIISYACPWNRLLSNKVFPVTFVSASTSKIVPESFRNLKQIVLKQFELKSPVRWYITNRYPIFFAHMTVEQR